MMEVTLLILCALEYLCVKLFCIVRRGGGWLSTSRNRQINTGLGMVVNIYLPWHFGESDATPNYVDYDRI